MKKKNITLSCPECHSRRLSIVATKRKFSLDKAATGGIIGGLIGSHSLGLACLMGIDGKKGATYLQCDICKHVWKEK